VTDSGLRNIDDVALARTRDRVLHVAWRSQVGSNESVRHATVKPNGTVAPATTAVSAFAG
jgi:hypothetical protein